MLRHIIAASALAELLKRAYTMMSVSNRHIHGITGKQLWSIYQLQGNNHMEAEDQFNASLSALATVNFAAFEAEIVKASPVFGFRPWRSGLA